MKLIFGIFCSQWVAHSCPTSLCPTSELPIFINGIILCRHDVDSVCKGVFMKRKISSTHTTTSHKRNGRPSRGGEATEVRPFPARMPLGQFLFEYLHRRGVRHSFGVPGDFALPTFAWLEKSPIKSITMTHEPGAGFAADAYSRLNGIGLVCGTYCVGGVDALNPLPRPHPEKSPVVVVSGAPGREDRKKDP